MSTEKMTQQGSFVPYLFIIFSTRNMNVTWCNMKIEHGEWTLVEKHFTDVVHIQEKWLLTYITLPAK